MLTSQLRDLRLHSCEAISDCGAACCSKGVRVDKPEADRISAFVCEHPDYFRHLEDPEHAFVPPDAFGYPHLRQTEIVTPGGVGRRGLYRARALGEAITAADNEGAMCVFAFPDGRCSLQVASRALGYHKWEHKPTPCWLFPLKCTAKTREDGTRSYQLDWIGSAQDKLAHYPCARRDPDGFPALAVLREELEHFTARFGNPEPEEARIQTYISAD